MNHKVYVVRYNITRNGELHCHEIVHKQNILYINEPFLENLDKDISIL